MKPPRPRAPRARRAALAVATATLLAGCGEIKNTITPPPGTANSVTVVLAGAPNAFDAGIYEAQGLGFFRQTDLDVHVVIPAAGQDPITMLHDGQALFAISSEPSVLLHRNEAEPVVSVAAIVHAPLPQIPITVPSGPSGGGGLGTRTTGAVTGTTTTQVPGTPTSPARTTTTPAGTTITSPTSTAPASVTTTTPDPAAPLWPAKLQQLLGTPGYPAYDGLVIVVRKDSIVNDAPLLRRFVQAVARGYRAARANPTQAINKLLAQVPSLVPQRALETATLQAALPQIFPPGLKVWGYQQSAQWNAFGTWLTQHGLLSDANAIIDASTDELLPGQGV
jgi:putative hydroxymethylpyrimidine transport system substrate-binding protein